MGYDVHITRREQWEDDSGPEISSVEWEALVRSEPDMAELCWFDRGNITSKNPEKDTVRRLVIISERLEARLQGDDGEIYSLNADGLVTNDQIAHRTSQHVFGCLGLLKFGAALIVIWAIMFLILLMLGFRW